MNSTYSQQQQQQQHGSPLCHHGGIRQDATYRPGATTTATSTAYPPANPMPLPTQSHNISLPYATGSYIPLASSRTPIQESVHSSADVLASLPPGGQPPPLSESMPTSCHHNGKKYQKQCINTCLGARLVVVQQPQRARMCGFGDKDRRPITPPPCVKLIVTDLDTGKESDFKVLSTIEHGMFVLNVDLWSADKKSEVNLVRQTANSPSISSTISVPYQDSNSNATYHLSNGIKSEPGQTSYTNHYPSNKSNSTSLYDSQVQNYNGQPPYSQNYGQSNGQTYPSPNSYSQPPTPQQMYFNTSGIHTNSSPSNQYADPSQGQLSPYPNRSYSSQDSNHRIPVNNPAQGMFTRNLIGSLAASAFRLTDPEDKIGIWFVLQDLSVRTEGDFRLRFSFVNVSEISPPPGAQNGTNGLSLNKGKSPVLARCFSDVFSVYSAKRFPGVVESTPLSRCFATQGIKIPIRKDAAKGDKEKDDEDD
ncbi:Velvet complex subunit 2 [Erysiphe neolycopersici]|uniref:Velvet complex subunit 2 n=1 Tax=Erysiphe neolycopersici TaxID=212602 RepID=A0A420H718_9PEZI|nr:Velvet complex subunit 2 [Erysiphe neolycopersici]